MAVCDHVLVHALLSRDVEPFVSVDFGLVLSFQNDRLSALSGGPVGPILRPPLLLALSGTVGARNTTILFGRRSGAV